jgi:hypothetical protein
MTQPLPAKLPKKVEGLGGAITLRVEEDLSGPEGCIGRSHFVKRIIELQDELDSATAVATFYHELFHMALYDSGQHHDFDEKQTEKLCDLVGAMMARLDQRL